jgi:kynurenine formamidase
MEVDMNNPAASNGVSIVNSQTAVTGLRQFYAASCGEFNPKRLNERKPKIFTGHSMTYIDLSHDFENNMPGFKLENKDGTYTQYTAQIRPFLTHEQSASKFDNLCSFGITEITFQTSIGTYIYSPYHHYPNGKDSQIQLENLIAPGVIIDMRNKHPVQSIPTDVLPPRLELADKAVFFNFGYDQFWGKDAYYAYPFLDESIIDHLIATSVKLLGVDTINIDNCHDLKRPAHSTLLRNEIIICEKLCNLDALYDNKSFTFCALPIKAKQCSRDASKSICKNKRIGISTDVS